MPKLLRQIRARNRKAKGIGKGCLIENCNVVSFDTYKANMRQCGKLFIRDLHRDISRAANDRGVCTVLCLQEGLLWEQGNINQHIACTREYSDCGLLVPQKYDPAIRYIFEVHVSLLFWWIVGSLFRPT